MLEPAVDKDRQCQRMVLRHANQVQYVEPRKITLSSGLYLRNRSTLDIGVLGYIGIVQHKKHPSKFGTFLLGHHVDAAVTKFTDILKQAAP